MPIAFELSDGSNYEFDDAHSLLGRAGMAFGVKCPNEMGSVHARVSAVQLSSWATWR